MRQSAGGDESDKYLICDVKGCEQGQCVALRREKLAMEALAGRNDSLASQQTLALSALLVARAGWTGAECALEQPLHGGQAKQPASVVHP